MLLNPARLLVFAASLVPVILIIMLVVADGLNAPFFDQWHTSVPLAFDTLDGKLSVARLTAFHGEHRILFTNILTAISARFFEFNLYLELFFTILLGVALLLIVVALIRKDFPQVLRFVLIPVSVLIFSLRGQHTWLTSFQSCFLWVTLFFLLAIWVLRRQPVGWRPLLLAALFALCATFSLGNGIIVWFLLLPGLALFGYRRRVHFVFWAAATIIGLFLYYAGADLALMFGNSASDAFSAVEYMLVYIGSIFVPAIPVGVVGTQLAGIVTLVSIALLLANLVCLWRSKRSLQLLAPWLLIAGYVSATGFITGIGRNVFYVDNPFQALAEKYTIMAVFWWISQLVLGAAVVRQSIGLRSRRLRHYWLSAANVVAFVVLLPLALYAMTYQVITYNYIYPESESCFAKYVLTHDRENQCLSYSFIYQPDEWLPRIEGLAARGLAMFSESPLNVDLIDVDYTRLAGDANALSYLNYTGETTPLHNGLPLRALFEHAPAEVEYELYLPESYQYAEFAASLYLDPSNLLKDPGTIQDGVLFSVTVIGENGDTRRSDAVRFDPHTMSDPIPFEFDLTEYVGQPIHLRLQTESLESVAYDWALWIDPTIRLSHTVLTS
ncbi:MAG: hypothetical protein ABI835_04375 [Chloroflexota bacterium]